MVRTGWGWGVSSISFYPTFPLFFFKNSSPPFQTLVIPQQFHFPNPPSLPPHFYTPSNPFETLHDAAPDLSECGKGYVFGGGYLHT